MSDEFTASDRGHAVKLDEIGYWSEVKLDIVKDYAGVYATILRSQVAQGNIRQFAYIDAFSGAGVHISKTTGEYVSGSPLNALLVKPPFDNYYFVDINTKKAAELRAAIGDRPNVRVWEGDCNQILTAEVFPLVQYKDFRRALCLLDPYGLHLSWQVILEAGKMRSIDMFLNFPIMDMNMNVLLHDPAAVDAAQAERMTRYWGDGSWRRIAYRTQLGMFDDDEALKLRNEEVVAAFRERLKVVAGFNNVPEPLPMRNEQGATVYYLFFASQKNVANDVVMSIFRKYASRLAPERRTTG